MNPPNLQSPRDTPPVASPCINVCRIDEASGWCSGCLRTLDEIAFWSQLDDADKRAVWAELALRRVEWSQRPVVSSPAKP
jgi:predicted Fe-S protein YdhL (DUF1289 family)